MQIFANLDLDKHIFYSQYTTENFHLLIHIRVMAGLESIPVGKEQTTPWRGCQSIAGLTQRDRPPFMLTFTATNLESSRMSLDHGRKPKYLQ